jgi:hypothetical protein
MSDNNQKQNDWKQREVGALWKKSGPKGSYCTGYMVTDELGTKVKHRVIMFSNKEKSNEKSPDFVIYLSNEQSDKAPAATTKASTVKPKAAVPAKKVAQQAPVNEDVSDDQIPEM